METLRSRATTKGDVFLELPDRRLTLEEYEKLEALSLQPLEYRYGYAVELPTPTRWHADIAHNLVATLGPLVRAHGYHYAAGYAKVQSRAGDRTIPDFVVTCDARDLARPGDRENVFRHPCLIVEILSPATEAADRGEKLDIYETIPELTHYVLIDSRRKNITVYERSENGLMRHRAAVQTLVLPIAPEGLSIDAIYDGITFPLVS
jgi:Uma2 family endonuclease